MDLNIIPTIAGLSIALFVIEKMLSQAGKSNYAFVIDLIGFLILLGVAAGMMSKLFRTTISYFPL